MRERPKVGDRVEFKHRRGVRTGTVIGVAETGVHFLIELREPGRFRHRRVGIGRIVRILPKEYQDSGSLPDSPK